MSARSTSDIIARESVAEEMFKRLGDRRYPNLYKTEPRHVLAAGIESAADSCARHLSHGRLGLAHAYARVHAELLASQRRMHARWKAQRAAEEAAR